MSLNSVDQIVYLSVEAQEVGSGKEELQAQITGDDLDIAFNVRYLLGWSQSLLTVNGSANAVQCRHQPGGDVTSWEKPK